MTSTLRLLIPSLLLPFLLAGCGVWDYLKEPVATSPETETVGLMTSPYNASVAQYTNSDGDCLKRKVVLRERYGMEMKPHVSWVAFYDVRCDPGHDTTFDRVTFRSERDRTMYTNDSDLKWRTKNWAQEAVARATADGVIGSEND